MLLCGSFVQAVVAVSNTLVLFEKILVGPISERGAFTALDGALLAFIVNYRVIIESYSG